MKAVGVAALSLFLIGIISLVAVYWRDKPAAWVIAGFAAVLLVMIALLVFWEDSFDSFDWETFWRIMRSVLGALVAAVLVLYALRKALLGINILEAVKVLIESRRLDDAWSTLPETPETGGLRPLLVEWLFPIMLIMAGVGAILSAVMDDFDFLKPLSSILITGTVVAMVFAGWAVFPNKPDTPAQVSIPGVEDAEFDPNGPSLKYSSGNEEIPLNLVAKELIEIPGTAFVGTSSDLSFAPTMVGTVDGFLFRLSRPKEGETCDYTWVEYSTLPSPWEWLTEGQKSTGLIVVGDDESKLMTLGDNWRVRDGVLEYNRRRIGDDWIEIKSPEGCILSLAYPPTPEATRAPDRRSPPSASQDSTSPSSSSGQQDNPKETA